MRTLKPTSCSVLTLFVVALQLGLLNGEDGDAGKHRRSVVLQAHLSAVQGHVVLKNELSSAARKTFALPSCAVVAAQCDDTQAAPKCEYQVCSALRLVLNCIRDRGPPAIVL